MMNQPHMLNITEDEELFDNETFYKTFLNNILTKLILNQNHIKIVSSFTKLLKGHSLQNWTAFSLLNINGHFSACASQRHALKTDSKTFFN